MSVWLKGLNEEQVEAATHIHGPLLILAGAGSGKTTVLVSRTGYLLETGSCRAENLVVVTFTNKAARELNHRVKDKLGNLAKGLWTGTFHSFGLQILRKYASKARLPKSFGVIDAGDAAGLLKEIMLDIRSSTKSDFKIEKIQSMLSEWRSTGQKRAKLDDDYEEMVEVLLPKYTRRLELLGVADFDDLLLKPLELFESYPEILSEYQSHMQFLMVDEFQDTNLVQFKLLQKISAAHHNLAVVGDDDQSIYGWRGARIENILNFPRHFEECKVVRLEKNYRSSPAVLNVANSIIKCNEKRHDKVLKPMATGDGDHKPEVFELFNEDDESEEMARQIKHFLGLGYQYKDIAILYRSNGQGGLIETTLRQNQIPYVVTGGTGFFDRKESKDLLAYLKTCLHLQEIPLRRVINTPARGIGDSAVEAIEAHMKDLDWSFGKVLKKHRDLEFSGQHQEAMEAFWRSIEALRTSLLESSGGESPSRSFIGWVQNFGYATHIKRLCKDDKGFQNRWLAVEILARVLEKSMEESKTREAGLQKFLDSMELRDVAQDSKDEEQDQVQLLTLHACKGLEFPVVILCGVEEDLLPHKVLGTDVSEERRLFYVGVTRAKERLVLTRCSKRKKYGREVAVAPSRFLLEIPKELLKFHEPGGRISSPSERKNKLEDLMAKLQSNMEGQRLES